MILPLSQLPNTQKFNTNHEKLLDFGISIEDEKFEYNENYCIIPIVDVLAYALGISNSGKASSIVLAGFDGYGSHDPRHNEMKNLFELYEKNKSSLQVLSITPTKHPIKTKSLYGKIY